MSKYVFLAAGIALMPIATEAQAQDCVVSPVMFNSHIVETEGAMTVKAGRGCGFGVSGIGGAIDQTVITQKTQVRYGWRARHDALLHRQARLSGNGRIHLRLHRDQPIWRSDARIHQT